LKWPNIYVDVYKNKQIKEVTLATNVIMPVLGMSQNTGKLVRWLKQPGDEVIKGEPLMEVETDKAVAEIEAPASGVLAQVTAMEGDDVEVAKVVAVIVSLDETTNPLINKENPIQPMGMESIIQPLAASPLATRIAKEHGIDLTLLKPAGGRIEKADVMEYLTSHKGSDNNIATQERNIYTRKIASPKARRLASEHGIDLSILSGSGPGGAVIAKDIPLQKISEPLSTDLAEYDGMVHIGMGEEIQLISHTWRRMAERTTQSWVSAPHFFLSRAVNVARLIAWKEAVYKTSSIKLTITDLLIKITATAIKKHPHLNVQWRDGQLYRMQDVNIGIAVACDDGLSVPVIQKAADLNLSQIAERRSDLVGRAKRGKLRLEELQNGSITISNVGMYGVDAFQAILNPPQAAILAVGRIVDRPVVVNKEITIQPVMIINVSFDHRAVDGARGAEFLETLAYLIEEPLALLE
jgi:pyruvate dehydrogenase E2 component (dihydrolipoamide acetyltransferase)